MSIRNPIPIPKTGKPFSETRDSKTPSCDNKKTTLQLVFWEVSGKGFLQKDFQKRLPRSSQMLGGKAQSVIINRPGESGIADVVNELWILV